jgi:hypothetical protein
MKREELTRYLDELLEQGASGIIAQTACKWKDARRCSAWSPASRPPRPCSMRRLRARPTPSWSITAGSGAARMAASPASAKRACKLCSSTTSTSLPTICRSIAIPSSATTRSLPGASAGWPTALRRAGCRLARLPGKPSQTLPAIAARRQRVAAHAAAGR